MQNRTKIIDELIKEGLSKLNLDYKRDIKEIKEDFHKIKNNVYKKYSIKKPFPSIELIERYNELKATWEIEENLVFEKVLRTSQQWGNEENMMYVVGATQGSMFTNVRRLAPRSFLLVPGIGAQGGSLQEVCRYGMTDDCGLLVNSSRGIIYASSGKDFAKAAAIKAQEVQQDMAKELEKRI